MMDCSDKIKALQKKAGIEIDGVASSKTWLHIYYLLFSSIPYDINVESIIKAIQQKVNVRADGYPWAKTWDALYSLLIDEAEEINVLSDPENEKMLSKMTPEVMPFAKELIYLAARKGIHIRIIDKSIESNFGLSFYVGIFEKNKKGEFAYVDKSPNYAKVAKLGEFIGLTYDNESRVFNSFPKFEIVPAWALKMNDEEVKRELGRRKTENLRLLAIF
ncbi:hypothetical protein [Pedobacter frigiditerrae]|uniref:hypothetical protein n=1 Tax=Pedobacter frigiditerrae TaxID=2530452 RepID=UPI00292F904B|nr:hypothetical protein [Pedobacter frigiditerrae]